jgi:hypothetical protein
MKEKKRQYNRKMMTAERIEIIRNDINNKKSKTEILKVYRIPLFALSTSVSWDSIKKKQSL